MQETRDTLYIYFIEWLGRREKEVISSSGHRMLLEKFLSSLAYVNLDQVLSADLIKKLVSKLDGEFIASEYIIWLYIISYILDYYILF